MKFSSLFNGALALISLPLALAANSFSASNLYYAAGLTVDQQHTLLSGLQSAGVKVLRVWLDGKFTLCNTKLAIADRSRTIWDCQGHSDQWLQWP